MPNPISKEALAKMTPEQVADALAAEDGKARVNAALAGTRPPGPLSAEELALAQEGKLSAELVAEHWPQIIKSGRNPEKSGRNPE